MTTAVGYTSEVPLFARINMYELHLFIGLCNVSTESTFDNYLLDLHCAVFSVLDKYNIRSFVTITINERFGGKACL